ncbi:MAG: hypothetical protein NVSMB6_12450 [Burkholderiaceae bacterium]
MNFLRNVSIILVMLLIGGCAGTSVRSEVTTFQEWAAYGGEKVFSFERGREQDNNLEYRTYEILVRKELERLGFSEAGEPRAAQLRVSLAYSIQGRDVRVVQGTVTEPFWSTEPLYGHRWRGRGYYGPFYDPFWPAVLDAQFTESTHQIYSRQLKIKIAQTPSGKNLYEVTVNSEGANGSLPSVMPYMIRSAFMEFPGKNGAAKRIDLKMMD